MLEALKRAEDKGRRRRSGPAAPEPAGPVFPLPQDPALANDLPDLVLSQPEDDRPLQPVELTTAPPADGFGDPGAGAWEPELAPTSRPVPLAAAVPPPAAEVPPPPVSPPPARAASPRPAPTHARSADRLLQAQARTTPSRQRQTWLAVGAVVSAAAVGALWFWPDEPAPPRRMANATSSGPLQGPVTAPPVSETAPVSRAPDSLGNAAPGAVVPVPATPVPAAPLAGTLTPPPAPAPAPAPPPAPAPVPAAAPLAPEPPRVAPPVARVEPVPPAAVPAPTPAREPTPAPVAAARPPRAAAAPARPAPSAPAPAPAAEEARSSPRQQAAMQLQRQLQQAYADFQAGRTQEATRAWRDILAADPTQRDAWLGLAISAHRQGQLENALAGYQQVLRLDPENGEALAAVAALGASSSDTASESRLRDTLARNPNNAMINSALARLLSAQSRWDEAQPYWFAAHAAAPEQPMHAYNLAVALDRLRKTALAAQYYRKALALQEGRAATFDAAAARARLQVLEEAAGGSPP